MCSNKCNSNLLVIQKLPSTNAYLGHRIPTSSFRGYLYGFRNEMAIIDLEKTLICLRRACNSIGSIISAKGHLLLVNTNPEYNGIIQQMAKKTNQSYINHKWIGGFLTNWKHHMKRVQKHFQDFFSAQHPADDLKDALTTFISPFDYFPRFRKMQKCFEGIVTHNIPDCSVIINNANRNSMAILEANQLQIPIVALVDSNIPNRLHKLITYPVPVNDDSIKFVYPFRNLITKTVILSKEAIKPAEH
uniref:Ribosomal protein S2 n=1 Tax=Pellia epiphylla TaxID=40340 RepID=A0A4Y5WS96_9MARC|nr:ribosomal protein S2 [Pellia epiphylla]WIA66730.1 ribosomal protein S2 [Pellia epiphylla var. borealis]QDE10574.1 ribosomal protein S2 [Pellia epiphylla]WIA66689.1 ribosomal protein S2 [Pellia epiphylla]WIA66771.1 ribosomal protein S2 [Pellia epiphylla var. borealis]WIA66812.1 ribosomal protein S2 [Pellia epiphylla]